MMRGLYTLRKYVIMHLSMYRPTYWQRWGVWSIEWDIFFPHKMSQAFTGILQITGWKLSGDIYNNFVHNIGLMGQGLNCLNLVNPPSPFRSWSVAVVPVLRLVLLPLMTYPEGSVWQSFHGGCCYRVPTVTLLVLCRRRKSWWSQLPAHGYLCSLL